MPNKDRVSLGRVPNVEVGVEEGVPDLVVR